MADLTYDERMPLAASSMARSRPARWQGIGGMARWLWRGAAQDDLKQVDHAAWVRRFGRMLATPLMVLFSIGSLIELSRGALQQYVALAFAGRWADMDIVGLVLLTIILFLIIGMACVNIVKAVDLFDKTAQGVPFREWVGDLALVLFISGVETVTYTLLLAAEEHPRSLIDWLLILLRAAAVPVITITLATLRERVPTERELKHQLLMKNMRAEAAALDSIQAEGRIEYLPMLLAFGRWLRGERHADAAQDDQALIQHINAIMPGAIQAQSAAEVDRIRQEKDAELTALKRQIVPWLMAVMQQGSWPAELLDAAPEYATIDPATLLKSAGIKAKAPGKGVALPDDTLENVLRAVGVKLVKAVKKDKDKKVIEEKYGKSLLRAWVASDAIVKLSGGKIPTDEAGKRAGEWGKGFTYATMNACPIKTVLDELHQRSLLIPDVDAWYMRQQKAGDATAMALASSGDTSAIAHGLG